MVSYQDTMKTCIRYKGFISVFIGLINVAAHNKLNYGCAIRRVAFLFHSKRSQPWIRSNWCVSPAKKSIMAMVSGQRSTINPQGIRKTAFARIAAIFDSPNFTVTSKSLRNAGRESTACWPLFSITLEPEFSSTCQVLPWTNCAVSRNHLFPYG